MIKVYCDMCGREIDYEVDGINLDFNRYGIVKFRQGENLEKQLCKHCAKKVCDYIDAKALPKRPEVE